MIFELLRWKTRDKLRCEEKKSSFFGESHETPPVSESTHRGGGLRDLFFAAEGTGFLCTSTLLRESTKDIRASQRLGLARHLSCKCSKGRRGFSLPWGRNLGRSFFRMKRERGSLLSERTLLQYMFFVLIRGGTTFEKRIASALQALKGICPKGIRKIELRYINKIELVQEGVGPNEYVTAGVVLPKELPLKVSGFFGRAESVYEDRPMQLSVTLASVESSNPKAEAFLLDLEVKQEWSEKPLSMADAIDEIDELRLRERIAFESCITERAREVFDAK